MEIPAQQWLYRFDAFTLDPGNEDLRTVDGSRIPLRGKSFALLRLMLENAGRLLGRDMIMEALWPNIVVSDDSITQCVIDVRRALGRESGHLLRTVPRRGYIFEAEVVRQEREAFPSSHRLPSFSASAKSTRRDFQRWNLAGPDPRTPVSLVKTPGVERRFTCVQLDKSGTGDPVSVARPAGFGSRMRWSGKVRHWSGADVGLHTSNTSGKMPRDSQCHSPGACYGFQLLRYDARGTGMSDWEANEISLEAWVQDLDTVVNAAEFDRFALPGSHRASQSPSPMRPATLSVCRS